MDFKIACRLKKFHAGEEDRAYEFMGCHRAQVDGMEGYVFRVWAPNASAVSLVGEFNEWNPETMPLSRIGSGVWEGFSSLLGEGDVYKYCVRSRDGRSLYKTDPYGFRCSALPEVSSRVHTLATYRWQDGAYRALVRRLGTLNRPVNIYEVHAGSWKRHADGTYLTYTELADELIPYVKDMGYTHIELMPLSEYPYDPSWGYQVTAYFAPTFRYGTPEELKCFVDRCHGAGVGVLLDWVPAHFPKDAHGLYEFDGTCQYELSDPLMNEHPDWTTRIFDYGKHEVQSFLVSNLVYWLREFHMDGIRVDAVASMLYLDYNRKTFRPNRFGGKENLEAIALLQKANAAAFRENPAVMMIAEESTAFPLITKPNFVGGLGFLYKWNMGWMNDMLHYMSQDPLFRKGNHDALTFSMTYAFSENYILPLSHDEIVHGKKSLIEKMPGAYDEKFQNLRAMIAFMMAHPGKKLLFMGGEFAQFNEWDHKVGLDFMLLSYDRHRQMKFFVKTLNHFYLNNAALWENDGDWDGFQWIEPEDRDRSIVAFCRVAKSGREVLVVCNFCPVLREEYRLGVPKPGWYVPVLCTDSVEFGGGGVVLEPIRSEKTPWNGYVDSASFRLPPLSVTYYLSRRVRPGEHQG